MSTYVLWSTRSWPRLVRAPHRTLLAHAASARSVLPAQVRHLAAPRSRAADLARKAAEKRAIARRLKSPHPLSAAVKKHPPSLSVAGLQRARNVANPNSPSVNSLEQSVKQPADLLVQSTDHELVLSPPALVVTREYEWGNIILGFEQANRYTIRAAPGGEVVGYIAETDSLGKSITRNVLRTHRPFKAAVLDKNGEPVFVLRRPFYVVSTSLYIEEPGESGKIIGEVLMSWHLWRRRYSLYVNKQQFAEIDGGFLAVDFDMRNEEGKRIASVNKDFTGFAREIFTDARQYVLRFDPSYSAAEDVSNGLIRDQFTARAGDAESAGEAGQADGKLSVAERSVILAAAISIDFDYFSLHSRGGVGPAGMFMPIPIPGGGTEAAGGAAGEGVGGADASSAGAGSGAIEDVVGSADKETGSGSVGGSDDAAGFGTGTGSDTVGGGGSAMPAGGSGAQGDSQWASFEEPDYGFQEDPTSSDAGDADPWSSGGLDDSDGGSLGGEDGGEGGAGGFVMTILRSIFWPGDE